MPELVPDTLLRQSNQILSTRLDAEIVALDVAKGAYRQLNPAAARIWEKLAQPMTLSQLLSEICSEYDAPEAKIRDEALDFVQELVQKNMLTSTRSTPAP